MSSNEYLKHWLLTLRVPPVRFYNASLCKRALFISLMHPPHYLFTLASSPTMKGFGEHRWLRFDHTAAVPAGPGAVLVRRHDRQGAAGSDPPAGGPQQGGGRLRSAAESEEQVADPARSRSASRSCGTAAVLQPAFVSKQQTPVGNTWTCGHKKLYASASQRSLCTGLLKMNITVCTYYMFLRAKPT